MAISLTTGSTYTQDFNTLAATGTSGILPPDWVISETGTGGNAIYTAGNGSASTGDTYSFGATSSTERSLGGLQSGSVIPTFGASFTNNTGSVITALNIGYTGEQWRLGTAARPDRLDFQYSTDATSLTTGTWTDADTLDFTAPITAGTAGALDGNAAANRTSINSSILALSISTGSNFWIRWNDFNATGADDGLAIDDFSISTVNGIVLPSVSIAAQDASAAEIGSDPGVFRITRTGSTLVGLTVNYTISGSATSGDYTQPLTGTVMIPTGATFVDITITPVDDTSIEGPETVNLTLSPDPTNYGLGTSFATVTIGDNDVPVTPANAIIITEVNPAGSATTSGYTADWFEVKNTGTTAINITGWKMDDNSNSFAAAVALRGPTSIAAGQSVIFLEGLADGTTDATIDANFSNAWFGGTAPASVVFGHYGGTGVGLSTGGDAVNLYDANGTLIANVSFGAVIAGRTFDNTAGINNDLISTASALNVNGAYASAASVSEIGSPGNVSKKASRNDFNNDSKSDILWRNDDGTVVLWQMDGNTVVTAGSGSVAQLTSDWKIAGTADFNNDKKSDILWRNDDGTVVLWQMDGKNITGGAEVAKLTSDWKIASTSDFNGDGKSDILWRNTDGTVVLWQMDGKNITGGAEVAKLTSDWKIASNVVTAGSGSVSQVSNDWKIAGTADFNGDSKSDILWRKELGTDIGTVVTWQMDGKNITAGSNLGLVSTDWKIAAPIL
jgi:Lamin Tail Domain/FG-GAP-like repeat